MKKAELLDNIALMRTNVEWNYPIDYAATLDVCEQLVTKYYQDRPNLDCALEDDTVNYSKWIPVTERLPYPCQYVWITCMADGRPNWVAEANYYPSEDKKVSDWGNIPILNHKTAKVIAWMDRPWPEPYRG